MKKARKVLPPRRGPKGDERRNLALEAAHGYEPSPLVRPDGLPREIERHEDRDGFEVLIVFRLTDDDDVVIHRVTIGDNRPVRGQAYANTSTLSRVLEGLPLTRWRDEALREWPTFAMNETAPGEWRDGTPEAVNRAKCRLGDGVEQAARIYLAHEGYDPVVAVSKQLEIGYETARKRISAARKRGLVPKAPGQGQRSHRQED
jgi:hypothetical protein